jgi:Transcriptional regulator of heat shock gene
MEDQSQIHLTERQKAILFAIIEEYAEMATPVGSVTLAKLFDVSSATIRAEMARLEELGLIASPHTSAGRIPTDAGYRFYVNALVERESNSASIDFSSPSPVASTFTSLGYDDFTDSIDDYFDGPNNFFLGSPYHCLASSRSLSSGPQDKNRSLHALEVRINAQNQIEYAIRTAVDMLVELTGNLGLATIGNQLYLSGISKLFSQPEFTDYQRIQNVSQLLDNLEPWLKEAKPGQPLNIFIGEENPIGKNSDVSLIISKFRSPYSDSSYIGILGPTRQNYAQVMSLVRHAGQYLENMY